MHGAERRDDALLGGDGFELYGGIVVGPAASGTQAVHVGLDVVVAELAYLARRVSWHASMFTEFSRGAHLIAAGARTEVPVGQVELLDAERAALLLVIVDELVLLYAGHGVLCVVSGALASGAGGGVERALAGEMRCGGSGGGGGGERAGERERAGEMQ